MKHSNNLFFLLLIISHLMGCRLKEYTNKSDYLKYKYLKKYVNKEFNKLNTHLMEKHPIKCYKIKNIYSIEGMSYFFEDSVKIEVICNRRSFIGKDSINKLKCSDIKLDKNVKVMSITIYENRKSKTEFYSLRW